MVGLEARFLRFWLARKQQEMTEDLGFVELELKNGQICLADG